MSRPAFRSVVFLLLTGLGLLFVPTAWATTRLDVLDAFEDAWGAYEDSQTASGQCPYIDAGSWQALAWGAWDVFPASSKYDAGQLTPLGELILTALVSGDFEYEEGDPDLCQGFLQCTAADEDLESAEFWFAMGDNEVDQAARIAAYDTAIAKYNAAKSHANAAEAHFNAAKPDFEAAIYMYACAYVAMSQ